jgi:hypothetical protein
MTSKVMNEDIEICQECNIEIDCNKDSIFIITKGKEERLWCHWCFEDLWKEYSDNGWAGDDIEYYLELEKEDD